MKYLSLAQRVPELTGIESKAVSRFYSLFSRLPLMRSPHRRFVAGVLCLGVTQGNCLDIGTGPGSVALNIAQQSPSLRVVGLDLSAPMLHIAAQQASRLQLNDREFWPQADGHDLPFASGSFDLVVSSFALHHWRDPVRILNEIARVLAPGGRYYIGDICREPNLVQRVFAWGSIPFVSLPLGSYRGYGGYYESMRASYTRAEARALLQQSALHAGQVRAYRGHWIPTLAIFSEGGA